MTERPTTIRSDAILGFRPEFVNGLIRERDEAREIARELAAYIRATNDENVAGQDWDMAVSGMGVAWEGIRPGVRKYLEGG